MTEQDTDQQPASGLDTRGSRPGFFERSETDVMMTALLETMSQLWVTRRRLETLEKAVIDSGVLSAEQLGSTSWTEEEQAEQARQLQNFFTDAFRAAGGELQSLDARESEIDRFQARTTGEK